MTGDAVPARTTTRGPASGKLRTWARGVLARDCTEETVLDAIVVLEELAGHVCRGGRPAQVRLFHRTGNLLRIEVDDERPAAPLLGSDVGILLVRHLSKSCGVLRRPGGTTFWAEVTLLDRRVPGALPGGPALGPFVRGPIADN